MKTKGIKILVVALIVTLFTTTTVFAAKCIVKKTESYLTLEQDVYYPAQMDSNKKYPVVFLVHNGGTDRSAWGDFPQDIANAGFFTVNLTWQAWDTSNVESAINYTLQKYADIIDPKKVVMIGGCHGGKDVLEILNKENKDYTVKTAVLLSVSEIDESVTNSQKKGHIPMLVYYSLNDEIGDPWATTAAKFATEVVTKPCKVLAQKDPAHGNNMVTISSNKDVVRKGIIGWIKQYTK